MLKQLTIILACFLPLQGCLHRSTLNDYRNANKRQEIASLVLARKFIDAAEVPSKELGLEQKIQSPERDFFALVDRLNVSCELQYNIKLQRVIDFKKLFSFSIDARIKLKDQDPTNRTSLGLQVIKLVLPQDFKYMDRFPEGRYYDVVLKHYRQLSGFISKTLITSPGCERVREPKELDKTKN